MKKIFTVAVLTLLCSCAKQTSKSTAPSESKEANLSSQWIYLEKNSWQLIQMHGKVISEFQPTIQFNKEKGTFAGSNGCNRYFGNFSTELNRITVKAGGATMMMCPEEAMNIEREFTALIDGKTYTYDLADQTLNFYSDGTLVLMFGKTDLEE